MTGWKDEDREVEEWELISGVGKEGGNRQLIRLHQDNGAAESGMRMTVDSLQGEGGRKDVRMGGCA